MPFQTRKGIVGRLSFDNFLSKLSFQLSFRMSSSPSNVSMDALHLRVEGLSATVLEMRAQIEVMNATITTLNAKKTRAPKAVVEGDGAVKIKKPRAPKKIAEGVEANTSETATAPESDGAVKVKKPRAPRKKKVDGDKWMDG